MLIASISGIRGTIGGIPKENLTPVDVVEFVSAYGTWVLKKNTNPTVCVGRDGRASGKMILDLTIQTLVGLGINVIDLDYATTPTVEMATVSASADGAIIITASHNPKPYNGLKMLNSEGEFLSAQDGQEILDIRANGTYLYADINSLGCITKSYNHTRDHIQKILDLDLVDAGLVSAQNYTIAVDAINSVGGIAVPMLLEKMGVNVVGLNLEPNGDFQHQPEPLRENLGEIMSLVPKTRADLGIVVDPDVDRLVLIDENGEMVNEEYGLVMVSDYVLSQTPGSCVSNLSSSRALRDVAEKHDVVYAASAVGEKNVVEKMKEINAVIGGEGSGGIIYPELHYGRDALVGIALFLTALAREKTTVSKMRTYYKDYFMVKDKIELPDRSVVLPILEKLFTDHAQKYECSDIDGVKINFEDSWIHIRASNTEPILRIYTEAPTSEQAASIAQTYSQKIQDFLN